MSYLVKRANEQSYLAVLKTEPTSSMAIWSDEKNAKVFQAREEAVAAVTVLALVHPGQHLEIVPSEYQTALTTNHAQRRRLIRAASREHNRPVTPGTRICSTNRHDNGVIPGILATVDRVLPNGNFIIITDCNQTICVARNQFFRLSRPKVTAADFVLLKEMRISLC